MRGQTPDRVGKGAASDDVAFADLNLLRVFATVVECGGFSAAQLALGMAQSTLSSRMAALEAQLGERLCHRGRGGFRLTPAGQAAYEATGRLFASLAQFQHDVAGLRTRLVGTVRVGIVDEIATNPANCLVDAVRRFKARDGRVMLHLAVLPLLERELVAGRLDLAVAPFFQHAAGMAYEPLFDEAQGLYCSAGHPVFDLAPDVPMSALDGLDHAQRCYMAGLSVVARPPALAPAALADNMEAIAMLVLSGQFVGYLPDHAAAAWVAQDRMRMIRPMELGYVSKLEVAWRCNGAQPAAVRAFLDDLRAAHGTAWPRKAADSGTAEPGPSRTPRPKRQRQ